MSKEILNKLKQHDKRFNDHDKRFESIDKRFIEVDKRFDAIDKRLDNHDEQFQRVIGMLLEHDDRLDNIERTMATKNDINMIMNRLDEIVLVVKSTNQELTALTHNHRRLDDKVERHQTLLNTHGQDIQV